MTLLAATSPSRSHGEETDSEQVLEEGRTNPSCVADANVSLVKENSDGEERVSPMMFEMEDEKPLTAEEELADIREDRGTGRPASGRLMLGLPPGEGSLLPKPLRMRLAEPNRSRSIQIDLIAASLLRFR